MKGKMILPRAAVEIRWALMHYNRSTNFYALCGKYTYPIAASVDPKTKTFTTRKEARDAVKSQYDARHTRVIKVRVTVTPIV